MGEITYRSHREHLQNVQNILGRRRKGMDCEEHESAELKQFIKRYHNMKDKETLQALQSIMNLFPLEHGEAWEEMENS